MYKYGIYMDKEAKLTIDEILDEYLDSLILMKK